MFTPLRIPNAFVATDASSGAVAANEFLFATAAGNVLVDPLPLDSTARNLDERGGVAAVILMARDRLGAAREVAGRYGAAIVDAPQHRDTLAPGITAIRLRDQSDPNAFAIALGEHRTVVAGDPLTGVPAGSLSLREVGGGDAVRTALGLRRILREDPETLLLSNGYPLFTGAYEALYRLLYETAGPAVHRINVDELDFRRGRAERPNQTLPFACADAEVGLAIGARKLGYRVSTLDPGDRFCPLHGHAREEELFFVIDGEPSVRMLTGTIRCRAGDFVAFPTGESGTHQLLNESNAPATVILLARNEDVEICYYPDSDKLLVDAPEPLTRQNRLLVKGSPELDYYDGESG
jgi:uncharacterized cupin superfamily protein